MILYPAVGAAGDVLVAFLDFFAELAVRDQGKAKGATLAHLTPDPETTTMGSNNGLAEI